MARLVTLTTDFGLSDHYVGTVKGAILSLNPDVTIVDVTHDINPQRVEQGAFVLECAVPYFPRGTIHVAVVDPGVGTERRAVAVSSGGCFFVGPDNGLLSCALDDEHRAAAGASSGPVSLPAETRAFVLSESHFHRPSMSATFHARDIFAPVAGHLSLGVQPAKLGPEVREMVVVPPFRGEVRPDGSVVGEIIHIDHFGNAVTTIRSDELPPALTIEVRGRRIEGLRSTYAELLGLGALIGSMGFLEIAIPGGNAAGELGLELGDRAVARSG